MAQRKYQIDKEHMAKLALVGAIAENGRQVGRGLNNIAESNRDRMHYWQKEFYYRIEKKDEKQIVAFHPFCIHFKKNVL